VETEDLIFNLCNITFASTPQTLTSNVVEKTVVHDLRLPRRHSFLVDWQEKSFQSSILMFTVSFSHSPLATAVHGLHAFIFERV
jgi:hypothetical protein